MFKNLRDLAYTRTWEEALGFYLVYALGLLAALFIIGPMMGAAGFLGDTPQEIHRKGPVYGCMIGMIYCGAFAYKVVQKKKITSWHGWALLALAILGAIPHGVVGMGVVAYITTRPVGWPTGAPVKQ